MSNNHQELTFDIVIATRNRVDVLADSIPLMLQQSRQANALIIVDSSDEHQPIKELVSALTKDWPGRVKVIHQPQPSITLQRNIGLSYVQSDVVMFPDDDSLWHPGVTEATMRIYEADSEDQVGGVCAKPVTNTPLTKKELSYKKSRGSALKTMTQPLRNFIEETFFKKPFNLFAIEKWKTLPQLTWLDKHNAVLVESMAGFRMSFRSSVIKQLGFDETIGSRVGYATHEDMEASINVLKSGYHLVAALDAKVFHHKHPSPRAPAFNYGLCQIINYLYIVRKHFNPDTKSWAATRRFLGYKVFLYWLGSFNSDKKKLYLGSMAGWKNRDTFLKTDPAKLKEVYAEVCDRAMEKQ